MKKFLSLFSLALLPLLIPACGGGGGANNVSKTKLLGRFALAQNCEQIQGYVQDLAQRVQKNPGGVVSVQNDGFARGAAAPTATDGAAAPESSQGGGVTQSDIAYADSARGLMFTASWEQKLKVFKVGSNSPNALLTTLSLDFYPLELLGQNSANQNFLMVFGSTGGGYGIEPLPAVAAEIAVAPGQGYEEPQSVMALFDVTDPAHPQELKRETAPGGFLEARAISEKSLVLWVLQRWVPLQDAPVSDAAIFPVKQVRDNTGSSSQPLSNCADTYLYQNETLDETYAPYSLNETVVHLLDLSNSERSVSSQTIFSPSWRNVISVNPRHLFLAQNVDLGDRPDMELFQFDISGKSLQLVASGQVPGEILNQFFIDEQGGVLRVFHHQSDASSNCINCVAGGGAGTEPAMPLLKSEVTRKVGNYLSTFRQEGESLKALASFGPFEEDEVPYAARFLGKLACIVTFQQIDPLTCFELSDPNAPIKLGALHLGGVSFHLEPINDRLLLGVGRGEGNASVVVNLFDISDPTQPSLADQEVLASDAFAYSPVFYDYRALGKDESLRSFSVPLDLENKTAIKVLQVDPQAKSLALIGGVEKVFGPDGYDSYQRGYFFKEVLVALSFTELEVFSRSDWSQLFHAPLN